MSLQDMSQQNSGVTAVNSGPLVIRTYNQSVNGSSAIQGNTTYVVGNYEYPISSNYVLITSTGGLLKPSDAIYVSSVSMSTVSSVTGRISTLFTSNLFTNNGYFSTLTGSTLNANTMFVSTLTGSTINASTINASTINAQFINYSTLTGSTINASTINASTINAQFINYSTLTGSTLNVSTIVNRSGFYVSPIINYSASASNVFNLLVYGTDNQIVQGVGTINNISSNVFLGTTAGIANTSGNQNTFIGTNAGTITTSGKLNTCIGYGANSFSAASNYEIVIGAGVTGKGTNTCQIGVGSGDGQLIAIYWGNGASSAFSTTSDRRIKTNITGISSGLSILLALRPVEFDYLTHDKSHQIGFIAQEYQTILPDQIVYSNPVGDEVGLVSDKVMGIQANLTPYLVKAIQEQQMQISTLQGQVAKLLQVASL